MTHIVRHCAAIVTVFSVSADGAQYEHSPHDREGELGPPHTGVLRTGKRGSETSAA